MRHIRERFVHSPLRTHYKARRVPLLSLSNTHAAIVTNCYISSCAKTLRNCISHNANIYKLDKPHPAFQNLENGYCRFLNNRSDISTSADISAVFSLILENEYFRFLMHWLSASAFVLINTLTFEPIKYIELFSSITELTFGLCINKYPQIWGD